MKRKMNTPGALALALSAVFVAPSALALEMGKLVVYSHLSEPLSAAVPIGSSEGRPLEAIRARVASVETYANAGVKRPAWLDGARVEARFIDSDRVEIRISTSEPVETPAASLILEVEVLDTGKSMAREYAVILDPVEGIARGAGQGPGTSPKERPFAVPSTARPVASAGRGAGVAGQGSEGSMVVKSGQVLYAIAKARKPEDVSVERMMIGMLRANPDAFVGGNINRLKAGAILRMPGRPELEALRQAEAVSQVNKQAGEFSRWRGGAMASAAPIEAGKSGTAAGGKIAPAKAAPDAVDVLRLGKADAGGKSAKGSEVDAIAKSKALDEANARVRDLERMRDDLQKLLTLRDKQLADAQKSAAPAPVAPVAAPATAPAVVAAAPAVVAAAPAASTAASPAPADVALAAPAADPAASAPKPAPRPAPKPAPPPEPEPSMMDSVFGALSEYGLYLAGLLAVIFAAVYALGARRRKQRASLRATTIDPRQSFEALSEAGSAAPSAFDERIDGADTYLALGDLDKAQAELDEALAMEPDNLEALVRLARVAAKRGDRAELGRLAGIVGDQTFRSGSYWDELEGLLSQQAAPAARVGPKASPPKEAPTDFDALDADFGKDLESSLMDLVVASPAGGAPPAARGGQVERAAEAAPMPMDFNLDFSSPAASSAPASHPAPAHGMSFDLDLPSFESPAPAAVHVAAPVPAPAASDFDSLSFDLSLPDDKPSSSVGTTVESVSFDSTPAAREGDSEADSELRTMFELAKAYVEMGDTEGARELLVEISAKASTPDLAAKAKALLSEL